MCVFHYLPNTNYSVKTLNATLFIRAIDRAAYTGGMISTLLMIKIHISLSQLFIHDPENAFPNKALAVSAYATANTRVC